LRSAEVCLNSRRSVARSDITGACRLQICPVHIAGDNRVYRGVYGSTHAQTNWTGGFSSNWFLSGNWDAGFPRQTTDGDINTVTPNATVISDPGAQARNLTISANGTGMLTILAGGTLVDQFGTIGDLPGGGGTVMVTGLGSSWTNVNDVVVGGLGSALISRSHRRLRPGVSICAHSDIPSIRTTKSSAHASSTTCHWKNWTSA
jgi:T5SS/PEP-CTERM-associated repeat protein